MIFNKNILKILLRISVIALFLFGAIYNYLKTDFVIGPIMFVILTIISVLEMTWYLQRSERDWSQFLLSIQHQDFSRNYKQPNTSKQLQDAFELITVSFEKLKTEIQADHRLLQTVLGHIPVGLACSQVNGEVVFANKAIKTMLGLEVFIHIDVLKDSFPEIYQAVTSHKNLQEALVDGRGTQNILLKTETFVLRERTYKLVSMTDIRSTLDTHELDSYQKLMKVMTHEIMNSATPILSLVQVVNNKLINGESINNLDEKNQKNVALSLKAVELRTNGILKFVEAYRKINKEFSPAFEPISTSLLLDQTITVAKGGTDVTLNVNDLVKKEIFIDVNLIAQVMINLIQNALDAIQGINDPIIAIKLEYTEADVHITIEDNGPGVLPENTANVFIPFFTTKDTGSGIGLAISRKIIKAHGGKLSYQRIENMTTQFEIILPDAIIMNDLE